MLKISKSHVETLKKSQHIMHAVFPKIVTLFNSLAARATYIYMYMWIPYTDD